MTSGGGKALQQIWTYDQKNRHPGACLAESCATRRGRRTVKVQDKISGAPQILRRNWSEAGTNVVCIPQSFRAAKKQLSSLSRMLESWCAFVSQLLQALSSWKKTSKTKLDTFLSGSKTQKELNLLFLHFSLVRFCSIWTKHPASTLFVVDLLWSPETCHILLCIKSPQMCQTNVHLQTGWE